jgi:hypothetical protein
VKLRPIFVAWSLMFASIVCAGPPFVTDDSEIPPVGGWEIQAKAKLIAGGYCAVLQIVA